PRLLDPPGCRHVSPLPAITVRLAGPVGSTAGDHARFCSKALSELSGFTLPAPAMRREKWVDIQHGHLRRGGGSPPQGRSLRPPERNAAEQHGRNVRRGSHDPAVRPTAGLRPKTG